MPNPLFNDLGGNKPPANGNITRFINEFNKFKNSFRGDPQAEVQKLLNSGQMTQDQYNQLSQMAKHIKSMF